MIASAPALAGSDSEVTASTVVREPLALSKTKDMDFGWVAPPDAGTVVMTYDSEDGSQCVASAGLLRGGKCDAAEFVGLGSKGQRIHVKLPVKQRVILTGPGQNMSVTDLDIYIGDGLERASKNDKRNQRFDLTDDTGEYFFRVGGTLNVNANQASGLYEGVFTVEVDYH